MLRTAHTIRFRMEDIEKLEHALVKLSNGDFNLDTAIFAEEDQSNPLNRLNQYILNIRDTFSRLVRDTDSLTDHIKNGNLDHRMDTAKYEGAYSRIGESLNASVQTVSEPLTEMGATLKRISENDFTGTVCGSYNGVFASMANSINDVQKRLLSAQNVAQKISRGDTGELENFRSIGRRSENDRLVPAFIGMMETIRALIGETARISAAAVEGKLDIRGDAAKFQGEYVSMITGINETLDAVSTPLNAAVDMIGRLCENNYKTRMSADFKGRYLILSDSLNTLMDRLIGLQNVFVNVANGDISRVEDYRKIGKRSENDQIMPAVIAMMDTIRDIVGEAERLTHETMNGNIRGARGNAAQFSGGFREIVSGMNSMLDAASRPMEETLAILTKMAVNDFTEKMSSDYKGDFAALSGTINDVRNRLLAVQNVAEKISRGDTSELEKFRKIGKRSDNDQLVPAFTDMMTAIRELIDETTAISHAAVEGKLDVRGDSGKFQGDYISIINGINGTLDAVATPMHEITDVMSKMAGGSLKVSIRGNYRGEYEVLARSVNSLIVKLGDVITEVIEILSRIADGDLNIEKITMFDGDYISISESLKTIVKSLNQTLGSINTAAEQVAAGAFQISESSQMLSQGAEEQASSIEEVTASITELAEQVKKNAANANKANEISLATKDNAAAGNRQMEEMLRAMQEINEASSSISKIIRVIEDIASQTNILALNAAVEAARAGQYGKGFAVVAEEVRNLAAKSATAANETTALIDGSIAKVQSGSKTANETAQFLKEIVESIAKAAELVDEINSASNDQASAISQINQAINQVSRVIQTNSATAEESASASEELSGQSEMLKQMLSNFKLMESKNFNLDYLGLDPDLVNEIEKMIESRTKQKHDQNDVTKSEPIGIGEKAGSAPVNKPKISLDDDEFGKY